MSDIIKSIIETTIDGFEERRTEWRLDEKLFKAGRNVVEELTPFTWEVSGPDPDTKGYRRRKSRATYLPFGQIRADAFIGTIFQAAPRPGAGLSFGTLGEVRDVQTGTPTRAEQIWENANGTGHDAQPWDVYWDGVFRRASATEYRWVLVESPRQQAGTRAGEIRGARPYLVDFSPADVPYYVFENGKLVAIRIELEERVRGIVDGRYEDRAVMRHYLMTARGFHGFGTIEDSGYAFDEGGWWIFDNEGELVDDRHGTWDSTGGEIPILRAFDRRTLSNQASDAWTINAYALRYMDASSLSWNDMYVSGGRKRYWLGVTPDIWDILKEHTSEGAVDVPVPGEEGSHVTIHDTGSVMAGEGILAFMDRDVADAMRFLVRELTTSPDASGRAKLVEVLAGKSPRLAHMASNIEEAQNIALRFIEMRWTGAAQPKASVKWPRTFDLRTLIEKVFEMFSLMREAGAHSPTLGASLIDTAIKSSGFSTEAGDLDMEQVLSEITASLETQSHAGQVPSVVDVFRRRRQQEENGVPGDDQ